MADSASLYPAIADYALISGCHCAALISTRGSIDWCCIPRFDSDSCFGRLLDWKNGGHCTISPRDETSTSTRRYVSGTMILETRFHAPGGEARLLDFFVIGNEGSEQEHYQQMRLLEGVSGDLDFRVEILPRFDFGDIVPHVRDHGGNTYTAIGSNVGLVIRFDTQLEVVRKSGLTANFRVSAGERRHLSIRFLPPERIDEDASLWHAAHAEARAAFERTRAWWRAWRDHIVYPYEPDEQTSRSAIVLKSLSFERTGAIIAAPTTSLPESPGGKRNWDYRFSWVRDSVFTVRALNALGCEREADRFLRFIQRSSAGSANEMQIMYAVDGKRRLTEVELVQLEGYRGSRPVRIGNFASEQNQLDIYGEILEMAWQWHAKGRALDDQYWDFLVDVVNTVCVKWQERDHGIWEFRDAARHFVHSKAMCWSTLNRGILLAQERHASVPFDHWMQVRTEIRNTIERDGYDQQRGIFVQAFGSNYLDAALLLLPHTGFVAYNDPRMVRTTDAILGNLDRGGLLIRYESPDGLPGREGAFVPCTFWLVRCLAYQGRQQLAWEYYRRALACANELGLFSEEFDVESREMLGNFPQALTHVSQITAWLALAKMDSDHDRKR